MSELAGKTVIVTGASAICYAIGEPENVSVSEIIIRPFEQEM